MPSGTKENPSTDPGSFKHQFSASITECTSKNIMAKMLLKTHRKAKAEKKSRQCTSPIDVDKYKCKKKFRSSTARWSWSLACHLYNNTRVCPYVRTYVRWMFVFMNNSWANEKLFAVGCSTLGGGKFVQLAMLELSSATGWRVLPSFYILGSSTQLCMIACIPLLPHLFKYR